MNFENALNDRQKEAVFHSEGPLLILAGAGSGKTRVLMYKIAYLVENGYANPSEILAVTFTNKAAKEMKDRISTMLPGRFFSWIGTFHSFCARLLRLDTSSGNSNFVIYDEGEKKSVIREVLRTLNLDDKSYSPEKMSSMISRMKNQLRGPDQCDMYRVDGKILASVYTMYQEKLRSYGALDFDDLLVKTVELFASNSEFAEEYRSRFKYVLVDEYQDINYAQYMLIRQICRDHRNITVVGDDDQSIYRFRGADMSIILKFEDDYPDAHVVKLEQNYRSTRTILGAANAVMTHNKIRKEKSLWTEGEAGEKIGVFRASDGRSEARYVIRKMKELMAASGYMYKDFVVIYRTNAQSRLFEEVCMQEGIPYNVVGTLKFYDRKEIKDFLAYMKLVMDSRDNISLKRIINVPARGIGDVNMNRLEELAQRNSISLFEACRQMSLDKNTPQRLRESLVHFVSVIDAASARSKTEKVADVVSYLVEALAFREFLLAGGKAEGVAREENLNEFITVVREYQEMTDIPSLGEFLSHIALISDIDMWESTEGKVHLMTFHLTKGLEFPVVFLTGLEEKFLPHVMSSNEPASIEEERRLFYVGITRARERLFLTGAMQRMDRGAVESRIQSRFLKEIPSQYVTALSASAVIGTGDAPKAFADIHKRRNWNVDRDAFSASGENLDGDAAFAKGDNVVHGVFGKGRVLSVSGDAVKVDFVSKGIKTVVRTFLKHEGEGPPAPVSPAGIRKGDMVEHKTYGCGVISMMQSRDYCIVKFPEAGIQVLPMDQLTPVNS